MPPTQTPKVRVHQVLRYYNDVLAEHLDPDARPPAALRPQGRLQGDHDPRRQLFALGSTYRWEDGRSLSGLQVTVASGWDQVDWVCGASCADWDCHRATR